MKNLNNLHHAYLVVGEREAARSSLISFFKEQGVALIGSPDFFIFSEDVFGVSDARELNIAATGKAFGTRKIFFIAPERLTHEAQNALLKTFEDPYPDTHFFLVVREEALVLPTLRSRMQLMRLTNEANEANEAKKFLKLSLKDRLKFAKAFADNEKNLSEFLDELLLISKSRRIYNLRLLSDDRGAAPRLILEHLALILDDI
ncbi:MAG: hypothetical protein AAB695_01680 [Patescibacteria group bacterium]